MKLKQLTTFVCLLSKNFFLDVRSVRHCSIMRLMFEVSLQKCFTIFVKNKASKQWKWISIRIVIFPIVWNWESRAHMPVDLSMHLMPLLEIQLSHKIVMLNKMHFRIDGKHNKPFIRMRSLSEVNVTRTFIRRQATILMLFRFVTRPSSHGGSFIVTTNDHQSKQTITSTEIYSPLNDANDSSSTTCRARAQWALIENNYRLLDHSISFSIDHNSSLFPSRESFFAAMVDILWIGAQQFQWNIFRDY